MIDSPPVTSSSSPEPFEEHAEQFDELTPNASENAANRDKTDLADIQNMSKILARRNSLPSDLKRKKHHIYDLSFILSRYK